MTPDEGHVIWHGALDSASWPEPAIRHDLGPDHLIDRLRRERERQEQERQQ